MYHRILVPMDGGEAAAKALDEALAIARAELDGSAGSESAAPQLRLLYVLDDALDQIDMIAEGKAVLAEAARRASEAGVVAACATLPCNGRMIAEVILAQARSFRADLIVLGTHGRKGLRRAILGSVAESVIRQSAVPVLLPGQGNDSP